MGKTIPTGSMVYIRYLNHNLNCNIVDAVVHETVGWITQEIGNLACIQNERTLETLHSSSGSASGIILRKNCILEIRVIHEKGELIQTGNTICHQVP